jgi:cytochrome b involved in lipid metabolism
MLEFAWKSEKCHCGFRGGASFSMMYLESSPDESEKSLCNMSSIDMKFLEDNMVIIISSFVAVIMVYLIFRPSSDVAAAAKLAEAKEAEAKIARGPLTKSEVAKHRTDQDCWIIVEGRVYDITQYLDEHPGGGDVILPYAGKDATEPFRGTQHFPDSVDAVIKNYLIGDLVTDGME